MITRQEALSFLNEKIQNKNIIKHLLAVEACMEAIFEALKAKGTNDLGGTKEEWTIAGLLHDGDYCEGVPPERQGIQVTEWLKERGYEIPENVSYAMAAHNSATGAAPKTLMDWAIFCGDSLTGLIAATVLVLPDKKLVNVTAQNIVNRFKEKAFARGTRREEILLCEEKLGFSLQAFIEICLKAMQNIAKDLGL